MNSSRPVHLDLTRMKFPPMAIVSVMHRISGVVLFLLLPLVLYMLHTSLQSGADFSSLYYLTAMTSMKILLWILISAVSFHFFAGIRHMAMDCGFAESLKAGRISAYVIFGLEIIAMILAGVWLW